MLFITKITINQASTTGQITRACEKPQGKGLDQFYLKYIKV